MVNPGVAVRPDAIRRHNLALILGEIHRDGALTRAQLTHRLGVSRSTVGALVNELSQLGIVEEVVPTGGAGVGRPSHVVAPHASGPFVVAVDVDVEHLTVAAVGLGGEVLTRAVSPTGDNPEPDEVVTTVARTTTALAASLPRGAWPAGVGVSVPGTVDHRSGHVGVAPNLGWHDTPLGALLAQALPRGLPIEVGNDADLAVLAEHQRGNARGSDDVVYLMGRIGVGAGIIIGGQPLRGHDGHAGEVGHTVLDPDGHPCHCGKAGCVETYVSNGALLARAGRPGPASDDAVAELFAAARDDDATALTAIREVIDPLGRAIADLLNTLNPHRVLLGGSFGELLGLARADLERAVARYAFEARTRTVELVRPALGPDSALLGAAELAFAALLADPVAVTAAGAAGPGLR